MTRRQFLKAAGAGVVILAAPMIAQAGDGVALKSIAHPEPDLTIDSIIAAIEDVYGCAFGAPKYYATTKDEDKRYVTYKLGYVIEPGIDREKLDQHLLLAMQGAILGEYYEHLSHDMFERERNLAPKPRLYWRYTDKIKLYEEDVYEWVNWEDRKVAGRICSIRTRVYIDGVHKPGRA